MFQCSYWPAVCLPKQASLSMAFLSLARWISNTQATEANTSLTSVAFLPSEPLWPWFSSSLSPGCFLPRLCWEFSCPLLVQKAQLSACLPAGWRKARASSAPVWTLRTDLSTFVGPELLAFLLNVPGYLHPVISWSSPLSCTAWFFPVFSLVVLGNPQTFLKGWF